MRVILHHGAKRDLTSAGNWYEMQRAGLALEFKAEIDAAIAALGLMPRAAARWPGIDPALGEIRRRLVARFPFAVAYLMEPARIVVLAVAHQRRSPAYWLSRVTPAR